MKYCKIFFIKEENVGRKQEGKQALGDAIRVMNRGEERRRDSFEAEKLPS